jgi:predicted DsbA family dithiol-disulfide isomerase
VGYDRNVPVQSRRPLSTRQRIDLDLTFHRQVVQGMSSSPPVLQIDIVSDVVCPWCFVGKRQLEQALARYRECHPGVSITTRWHPFQLNPDLPSEGVSRSEYLKAKFGTDDTRGLYARVQGAAGAVGLTLEMAAIARQPNTLAAHALLEVAAGEGCQDALAEALFKAYFQQGRDLTDPEVLRATAQLGGLSDASIDRALTEAELHEQVSSADRRAREAGISGVPCFIIDRRLAVSGAQGAEAILEAMEQVDLQT